MYCLETEKLKGCHILFQSQTLKAPPPPKKTKIQKQKARQLIRKTQTWMREMFSIPK